MHELYQFVIYAVLHDSLRTSTVKPVTHQCIKFILFWNDTLHISDDLSVHHQEFKTVHTATDICLTNACCYMYNLELLMMNGKTV